MSSQRFFKFNGDEMTRGEYGVSIKGGHTTVEAPDHISVTDSDFGPSIYCSVETGIESGDFTEVTEEEWLNN